MQKVLIALGIAVGLVLGFSAEAAEVEYVQALEAVAPVIEQVVPDVQFPYSFAASVAKSASLAGSTILVGQPCGGPGLSCLSHVQCAKFCRASGCELGFSYCFPDVFRGCICDAT